MTRREGKSKAPCPRAAFSVMHWSSAIKGEAAHDSSSDLVCCSAMLQQHSSKSADTESERVSWVASWVISSLRTGFSRAAVFNFKLTKRRETRMVDKEAKLRHQPWVIITPFGVLHYSP